MNSHIQNFLKKIDNYFKDKTKKDIYMIYIMLFGIIVTLSYLILWESTYQNYMQIADKTKKFNEKIELQKLYLQNNPSIALENLTLKIQEVKKELILYKENNEYIKHKIKNLSLVNKNDQAFSDYLMSISLNAKKYNIKITSFTNEPLKSDELFDNLLDININTTGNYLDTLKFINALEKHDLLVDINTILLENKDSLHGELKISIWGMKNL